MDGICRPAHQVFYASRLATYNGFASKELYIELCTALRPRYWLGHAHNKAGLTFSAETSEKVASLTAEMIRPFTNTRLYATAGLLEEAREMLGPDAVFVDTELRACLYGGVGGFPRKQDEFACRVCLMNVEKKGSLCGLCEERGF